MTLSTVVGGYVKIFKPVSLKWTNWYKGWYANRKMKNQLVITGQNWTNWHFWWYILQSITHTYWFSQVFLSISSFIIKPAYFRGGHRGALRRFRLISRRFRVISCRFLGCGESNGNTSHCIAITIFVFLLFRWNHCI